MKMGKYSVFVFILSFVCMSESAFAQLVGVDRIQNHEWHIDNSQIQFGSLPDVACEYDTNQTNDALVCGLSVDSERMILSRKADMSVNFALSDLGSAGLSLMSNGGDKAVTFYHDDTNAVIEISSGVLSVPAGISTPTITTSGAIATSSTISSTNTNAASGSANPLDITSTLAIMNGSDDYTAIDLNITNADHTGSNTIQGLDVSGITGDAQATETAINIGNGWDVGINAGNNSITTTGAVSGASFTATASILSTAATNIGWSVVAGADTACNATCTNACVFGQNTGDMSIVDCAAATADVCVCAGAN